MFFKSSLHGAVDILDAKGVLEYHDGTRSAFQVSSTSGKTHLCIVDGLYCTCPAYLFSVVQRAEQSMVRASLPSFGTKTHRV